jgi:hypothetical protein
MVVPLSIHKKMSLYTRYILVYINLRYLFIYRQGGLPNVAGDRELMRWIEEKKSVRTVKTVKKKIRTAMD